MLAKLLASAQYDLAFNMLEVGARPVGKQTEPYHELLDVFPSSRLAALEIDAELCETLNRAARARMRYYPCALGAANETRTLYETAHGMCTSLYPPDERYVGLYTEMSEMALVQRTQVATVTLDTFVREHAVGELDFVKMDIQGAELDVLKGGGSALKRIVLMVCEAEFVQLYKGQPLFGDIDAHLRQRGFMLHKFLGFGGRPMKPLAAHGMATYPVQFMWCDAVFTRDLFEPQKLDDDQLLKLAVLLDVYDSKDVALYLLRHYDTLRGTRLGDEYMKLLDASGVWTVAKTA